MILDTLSSLVAGLFSGLVGLLPLGGWTPDISGAQTVMGYVRGLNSVVPVDLAVALFAVAVLYSTSSLIFDVGVWVYAHIPVIGKG